jgi:DNA-binding transcriptional LysR family regulator
MNGTIRLEDMRLFAQVAAAQSFTLAARQLNMPKQTLSRRVAELERALGVQLLQRTTRRLHLTQAGAAYAVRCADIVRAADEANRAVSDEVEAPSGTLRVTADPVFGEAFLTDLIIEYARRWPEVSLDVALTRRRVDLVEEGFDVAFRIGAISDTTLAGFDLGPARVRYCASGEYLARRGAPDSPAKLAAHDCLIVGERGAPSAWPFHGKAGLTLVPISGKLTVSSFAMARAAALAGLGIAIFPEFACELDLRAKRLTAVLGDPIEVGSVWLVHPAGRFLPARVRAFVGLARERFGAKAPWLVDTRTPAGASRSKAKVERHPGYRGGR